jgi:hypothetical protein
MLFISWKLLEFAYAQYRGFAQVKQPELFFFGAALGFLEEGLFLS